jgi:LysR family nitrogen assimilation transcriptional regulator
MDLRRLRAFVTVAEHGTVSKAAQVLHISQPALSRQIAAFEQELGFSLFQRSGRRLIMTSRADQLLGESRSLLNHVSSLGEQARALRQGDIRVLTVAASAMTIEGTFPTFLDSFPDQFPGVRLALVEADADKHLLMLERGDADFAINVVNVVEVDDTRFGTFLLPRFHIAAVMSASLAPVAVETIDIGKIVEHPLLLPNTSYATRHLFDAACRLADVRPLVRLESGSSRTLLALAEAGHGVAIIPSILRLHGDRLRALRITHRGEPLRIAPAVIWDKRQTLPHHAQRFSKVLAEHLRISVVDWPMIWSKPRSRGTGQARATARRNGRKSAGPARKLRSR